MLRIDYRGTDRRALISWEEADEKSQWIEVLCRLIFDHTEDATKEDAYRISIPWWNFAALRSQLLQIFKGYNLILGKSLIISVEASDLLKQSKRVLDGYELAKTAYSLDPNLLRDKLKSVGFSRELSAEQARNVCKIAGLTAAATFSVPGAGKTTEALACFFLQGNCE